MRRIDYALGMGFSPGYLNKIGTNFLVAALLMTLIMATGVLQFSTMRLTILLIFVFCGVCCFGLSCLKWKYRQKHWQKIGEPETTPQELRNSGKQFAQFGLVILIFIAFKTMLLKTWPDLYDVTGVVLPFLICAYLFLKTRRKSHR